MLLHFLIAVAAWILAIVIGGYFGWRKRYIAKSHGTRAPPSFKTFITRQWFIALHPTRAEAGEINISGILLMGIGMVFLAVGFIMFPIATDATDTLLAYEYSSNTSITDATYTGFTAVIGITPLLILLGFISAAVITGFLGFKIMKGAAGSTNVNPGTLMLLGLSIVFIAIGLIVEPVMLDGISSVVHGGGSGISTSYTGLSAIILVVPMLVHIAYLAAAVFTGFFGIKNLASNSFGG